MFLNFTFCMNHDCSNGNMLVEEQPEPVSAPPSVEVEQIVEQPDVPEQPTIIHETLEPEKMPEPEPQQPCE